MAVPVTADAWSEARKTHMLAISFDGFEVTLMSDVGRVLAKNPVRLARGLVTALGEVFDELFDAFGGGRAGEASVYGDAAASDVSAMPRETATAHFW